MISVIDYGVANLGSMLNMLRKAGVEARAVSTPAEVQAADRIIRPGVGAFDAGMSALDSLGLVDVLRQRMGDDRVPTLGVCLGMQMLGSGSEEGKAPGLGVIAGRCVRFRFDGPRALKVPHMGWNVVRATRPNGLLDDSDPDTRFYFVHSYHLVCDDTSDVLATTPYGSEFTSMIQRGNIWGAQFHPEKSHRFGMALLRNFARL